MASVLIIDFQCILICIVVVIIAKCELEIQVEEEVEVFETNTAELPCKVKNMNSDQEIAWYRGETKIDKDDNKDRYKIFPANYVNKNQKSYDLEISNISRNDKNERYSCRVLKETSEIDRSPYITLKIKTVPIWTHPYFYPKCERLVGGVRVGDVYRVWCETELTEPPVRLVLRKGDIVVCNRTAKQQTTCSYQGSVSLKDAGTKFTCDQIGPSNVPKYPKGVTRTCNIGTLNILQPPKVEITGETFASKEKEVVLICDPSESTSCRWIYDKDDNYMSASEEKTGNVCILRLTLYQTSSISSLNITCVARNYIGERSNSKVIRFLDSTSSPLSIVGGIDVTETNTKSPLWTGVIIAITGCFAIVIVLITSVILYCGWRHFLPVYSQASVPSQEIYSEQYNRSPYRMQSVQKCVAIQVTDEVNESTDDVEKKLTAETTKPGEHQHYSHICSP